MSRQDRIYPRTAAQLERQYNFGRSFAEVKGIANDAQTHAYKAEEVAKSVEAKVLNINVVDALNVSAGTITLKSQGLSIVSDGFSLSADKGITATRGNIGKWDISENSIFKNTDSTMVQIASPETAESDFITVATLENGLVKDVPLCFKANGDIYTKGIFRSSNNENYMTTTIEAGSITIDGEWDAHEEHMSFLLMKFIGPDRAVWGLYANGQWGWDYDLDVPKDFTFRNVHASRIE